MKKILLSAVCLLPLAAMAQSPFTVTGKVGSLNSPAMAYLTYRVDGNNLVDSSAVVNGTFKFKGKANYPLSASLRIKHDATPLDPNPKLRKPNDVLSFYLDKSVTITAADSVKNGKITGSKINEENIAYKALLKPLDDQIAEYMKEYDSYTTEQKKDTVFMKPFMEKYNSANKAKEPINKKFASENLNSYIGLTVFRSIMDYDPDPVVVEPEFLKYSKAVRATQLGKDIANTLNGAKKTQLGLVVTDFTQNDVDGKPVKLSDFKGKYVLVDFWASWCGPCRQENPNVVAAFKEYKDKNFTVLGVSLDGGSTRTTKEDWQKAIEADGLTWTHVSDLKGWQNEISKSFGVQAIPFNFMIDPSGKIVARNITGEALKTKLAELLGGKTK